MRPNEKDVAALRAWDPPTPWLLRPSAVALIGKGRLLRLLGLHWVRSRLLARGNKTAVGITMTGCHVGSRRRARGDGAVSLRRSLVLGGLRVRGWQVTDERGAGEYLAPLPGATPVKLPPGPYACLDGGGVARLLTPAVGTGAEAIVRCGVEFFSLATDRERYPDARRLILESPGTVRLFVVLTATALTAPKGRAVMVAMRSSESETVQVALRALRLKVVHLDGIDF